MNCRLSYMPLYESRGRGCGRGSPTGLDGRLFSVYSSLRGDGESVDGLEGTGLEGAGLGLWGGLAILLTHHLICFSSCYPIAFVVLIDLYERAYAVGPVCQLPLSLQDLLFVQPVGFYAQI